ncbi:recombinase family protein [Bacillus cereus]|uniref:recombinase family protein n=1 Tax=Bacillus cereus TaxID=1396 RepID=UPI0009B10C10|nr:recombinase family protein [Bacillus cereus]
MRLLFYRHSLSVVFFRNAGGTPTRTPTGKFFLTVMSAFSELDREMIKEKQIAGIKLAKQKGVYRGRVKKYTERHAGMNHAIELRQQTKKTMKEICAITGVSQAALYRKLKELNINQKTSL